MVKKITAKLKEPVRIGIIGGSGVYDIDGITDVKEIKITTPFGNPSDPVITGKLDGVSVAFLPRHGHGQYLCIEIHRSGTDNFHIRLRVIEGTGETEGFRDSRPVV